MQERRMGRYQWLTIVAWLTIRWPKAAELPESTLEAWYEDLARYPSDVVKDKMEAIYNRGLPWEPGRIGTELMKAMHEWAGGAVGREWFAEGRRLDQPDQPALPAPENEEQLQALFAEHGSWAEAFRQLMKEQYGGDKEEDDDSGN